MSIIVGLNWDNEMRLIEPEDRYQIPNFNQKYPQAYKQRGISGHDEQAKIRKAQASNYRNTEKSLCDKLVRALCRNTRRHTENGVLQGTTSKLRIAKPKRAISGTRREISVASTGAGKGKWSSNRGPPRTHR